MVHFNIAKPLTVTRHEDYEVHDPDCQHAFFLVGYHTVFAVHMTQFHCEKHKYQLIMELELPEEQLAEYRRFKDLYPDDSFVLSNYVGEKAGDKKTDKYSIPRLAGLRLNRGGGAAFNCVVHQGFRPPAAAPDESWFPWNLKDTIPCIPCFEVKVKRIVHFRPFSHNEKSPDLANYILWGGPSSLDGGPWEAHMTNVQYASLLSGPHEPWLFGLDVDHVMSLTEAPDWLDKDMLHAGTIFTVPAIERTRPRADGHGVETFLTPEPPWKPGESVALMYRGQQPPRYVQAGQTYLWASTVVNSPELQADTPNMSFIMSDMPKRYWK